VAINGITDQHERARRKLALRIVFGILWFIPIYLVTTGIWLVYTIAGHTGRSLPAYNIINAGPKLYLTVLLFQILLTSVLSFRGILPGTGKFKMKKNTQPAFKVNLIAIGAVLAVLFLFVMYWKIVIMPLTKNVSTISDRPLADEPSMGAKNAQDQKGACGVASFITKGYIAAQTDEPILKLYCKGGTRSYHIHIYGITKHDNQDIIVKLVETDFHKRGWKPVYLLFLERENFVSSRGGLTRANEKMLYSVVIN